MHGALSGRLGAVLAPTPVPLRLACHSRHVVLLAWCCSRDPRTFFQHIGQFWPPRLGGGGGGASGTCDGNHGGGPLGCAGRSVPEVGLAGAGLPSRASSKVRLVFDLPLLPSRPGRSSSRFFFSFLVFFSFLWWLRDLSFFCSSHFCHLSWIHSCHVNVYIYVYVYVFVYDV